MKFRWFVTGVEMASSPSSMERGEDETGTLEAEGVGEVLAWLTEHGTVWDWIDQSCAVSLRIEPVTE